MNFTTSLKRGLGSVALAASLGLFSSGALAVEVPVSCAGAICSGDGFSIPPLTGGTGWDLDFQGTQYIVPDTDFALVLDFTVNAGDFEPVIDELFLTKSDGSPITGSTLPGTTITWTQPGPNTEWIGSTTFSIVSLSSLDIYDFHLVCDCSSFSCSDNLPARFVAYAFDATDQGGTFELLGSVAVPSPGTLALLSIALLGFAFGGRGLRRRGSDGL